MTEHSARNGADNVAVMRLTLLLIAGRYPGLFDEYVAWAPVTGPDDRALTVGGLDLPDLESCVEQLTRHAPAQAGECARAAKEELGLQWT